MAEVQKGDIIFNYDNTKGIDIHKRHSHVVIAADKFSNNKSKVHGHTENKLDYLKEMDKEEDFRCYRVLPVIRVENCEKRVQLPETGNGGSVIN